MNSARRARARLRVSAADRPPSIGARRRCEVSLMPGRSFFLCTEREVSPRRRRERTSQTRARRRPAAAAGCGTTMTPAIVCRCRAQPSVPLQLLSPARERGGEDVPSKNRHPPFRARASRPFFPSSWAGEPPGPAGPVATDCCCRRRPAACCCCGCLLRLQSISSVRVNRPLEALFRAIAVAVVLSSLAQRRAKPVRRQRSLGEWLARICG